jgi:hypothetical protein
MGRIVPAEAALPQARHFCRLTTLPLKLSVWPLRISEATLLVTNSSESCGYASNHACALSASDSEANGSASTNEDHGTGSDGQHR